MPTKLVDLRLLSQALLLFAAAFSSETQCNAQGFEFQIRGFHTVRFASRTSPAVQVELKSEGDAAILVRENEIWWDLGTEEGAKHLRKLLEDKALRLVESHGKNKQLSPEQLTKLKIAAGVQVARDCRTIEKLVMTGIGANRDKPIEGFPQLVNDENGVFNKSVEIGNLIEAGVDRKDSLFVKVLNNLSE